MYFHSSTIHCLLLPRGRGAPCETLELCVMSDSPKITNIVFIHNCDGNYSKKLATIKKVPGPPSFGAKEKQRTLNPRAD